jgi:ParB-like chromosome segregation protein Spo0J
MKKSFDEDGQLQAALARPHPDPIKRAAGRIQLAFGHSRKEIVRLGCNAGLMQPEAHKFIGKLFVVVRPHIPDRKMLSYALDENDLQLNINLLDRAKAYHNARLIITEEMIEAGEIKRLTPQQIADGEKQKLATWRRVGEEFHRGFQDMQRTAQILELPEEIRAHFEGDPKGEKFVLNTRHARALLDLQEFPNAQKKLLKDILKNKWDGVTAEGEAKKHLDKLKPGSSGEPGASSGGTSAGGQSQGSGFSAGASSDFTNGSSGDSSGGSGITTSHSSTDSSSNSAGGNSTSSDNSAKSSKDYQEFMKHATAMKQYANYLYSITGGRLSLTSEETAIIEDVVSETMNTLQGIKEML